MTDSLTGALKDATAAVAAIEVPAQRFQAARELRAVLAETERELGRIEQAVSLELHDGRTWAEVGAMLGFSGSRAEAIARGR